MTADDILERRTAFWLLAVGIAAFSGTVFLAIYGDSVVRPRSSEASSFSVSAVGHGAFVELLREMGYPVNVSRDTGAARISSRTLLIIAEPNLAEVDPESLESMISLRARVLLVLPKWNTLPDRDHPGWIAHAELASPTQVGVVAGTVGDVDAPAIRRLGGTATWEGALASASPTLISPQVVVSDRLDPLIGSQKPEAGILLGRVRGSGGRVAVLTDPDLISNHGLPRGENAQLALAMIDELLPPGGTIVIDETVHGFAEQASIWRFFFRPPYLAATLLALAALALLAWSSSSRLGAAVPPLRSARSGSIALIETSASLLVHGRHMRHVLDRFAAATVASAAERLHVAGTGDDAELRSRMDSLAERRGLAARLHRIRHGQADAVATARAYHAWKEEMLGGPRPHRRA